MAEAVFGYKTRGMCREPKPYSLPDGPPDGPPKGRDMQDEGLLHQFQAIVGDAGGKVGISLLQLEKGAGMSVNGARHFAMQSVFKVPLAMFIPDGVDHGRFSLGQKLPIGKTDWVENTWSPMRDRYEGRATDIALEELLRFSVSRSDNIACDLLFRLAGGTQPVNAYVHALGVKDLVIAATEAQMRSAWDVQYKNWSTPDAMAVLFRMIYEGHHLSKASTRLLLKLMTETTTGPGRIKGLLPPGTPVSHKTGSSDTNREGVTAATNDAGIITLPDGSHLILVVFLGDAKAPDSTRDGVIARIAKAAFDHYSRAGAAPVSKIPRRNPP